MVQGAGESPQQNTLPQKPAVAGDIIDRDAAKWHTGARDTSLRSDIYVRLMRSLSRRYQEIVEECAKGELTQQKPQVTQLVALLQGLLATITMLIVRAGC